MTTVTFDGVALSRPSPPKYRITNDSFEVEFRCQTSTFADISALYAKAGKTNKFPLYSGKVALQSTGTIGSLVIGTDTYTNCAIDGDIEWEEIEGSGGLYWNYRVKFVRDTSS